MLSLLMLPLQKLITLTVVACINGVVLAVGDVVVIIPASLEAVTLALTVLFYQLQIFAVIVTTYLKAVAVVQH